MSGSAAAGRRSRGRSRFTPSAAILALVVVALLVGLAVPVRTLLSQRSGLARLEQQAQSLQRQNASLEHQLAQIHDPAYLERIARECLGMVKRGEVAFVVVPRSAPSAGARSDPSSDPLATAPAC